ncbi:MAG: hypothetical protein DHS20C01_08410 [marine bacterium B5-7]|nr:MAG: hypothetical protein DHS20C01_08410 [marine bacterium B5-7]
MANNGFYIPEPIYKVLPVLYIGSGIATALYIPSVVSVLSGLLLISAGIMVIMWRSAARSERRRKQHGRKGSRNHSKSVSGYASGDSGDMRWK